MSHGPAFSLWLACPRPWRATWRAAYLAERRAGRPVCAAAERALFLVLDLAGETV